ncbi:MAG: DUF3224 domain-containing protein [Solirubrobacteraceae bacterium]|nr:DUF3224 domain-containing protein [Solirubrobacteraceae bacterium]
MTQATETTTITVPFEIVTWDEKTYDEPADGPKLTHATLEKRYSGDLEATGVARILTAQGDGGRGYVASERVTGTLMGRTGTFVIQHGAAGASDEPEEVALGVIVGGSGTGELAGLRGDVAFRHDHDGARVTISWRRPD